MAISRKRKRELARIKGHATDLWDDQKDVLERANHVVREASRHARTYARDEVAPAVAGGLSATRTAASVGREHIVDDVFPAVSSALGSALAILEVAKDPRVRDALKRATKAGSSAAAKVGVKSKPSHGPGRYILIGVGVVAFAGIAYAAWQTLRADDDLWIDDEDVTEAGGGIQPS
jgi:hypothetical protein